MWIMEHRVGQLAGTHISTAACPRLGRFAQYVLNYDYTPYVKINSLVDDAIVDPQGSPIAHEVRRSGPHAATLNSDMAIDATHIINDRALGRIVRRPSYTS